MVQANNAIAALTSRRNFMKNAVATVAASALPVAAIASPPPTSPFARMSELVKELQEVAKLRYPTLRGEWTVKFAELDSDLGCKILIAAFDDSPVKQTYRTRRNKRRVRTA